MRDGQGGAGQAQRIAAQIRPVHGYLLHDLGIFRFRHVNDADAHRRQLVREEQNAPPVRVLMQRQTFTPFPAPFRSLCPMIVMLLDSAIFRQRVGLCGGGGQQQTGQ